MTEHKFSLVACARWEDEHILEWLDYHKAIGFDHVYLWSNDDDPEALRRAVQPHLGDQHPFVTFNHWPTVGQQFHIYESFLENYAQETEWFSFLDIDEFLVLRDVNDIRVFMDGFDPTVDCVYFHWANFGANGRMRRQPGSILTGLVRRELGLDFHTKNLVRSSKVSLDMIRDGLHKGALAYHHFWDDYKFPDFKICNVLGEETPRYTENFPIQAHAYTHRPGYQDQVLQKGYCAHFRFKSEEDFERRANRGGDAAQKVWGERYRTGEHECILISHDEVLDTYLADFWAPRQQLLDVVRRVRRTLAVKGSVGDYSEFLGAFSTACLDGAAGRR